MAGFLFLMSVVATGLVMWWVIQNDSAGPGEPTTGLFAMPREEAGNTPVPRAPANPARPPHRSRFHASQRPPIATGRGRRGQA